MKKVSKTMKMVTYAVVIYNEAMKGVREDQITIPRLPSKLKEENQLTIMLDSGERIVRSEEISEELKCLEVSTDVFIQNAERVTKESRFNPMEVTVREMRFTKCICQVYDTIDKVVTERKVQIADKKVDSALKKLFTGTEVLLEYTTETVVDQYVMSNIRFAQIAIEKEDK